ncbi:MAG: hypothetical protein PQJ59_01455 [Spirochaetales bacterium]|nr:hypothetical protein [Spirochaetales bacterium]
MIFSPQKRVLFLSCVLLLSAGLHALPSLGDFLSDEERARLNGQGEITLFHYDETEPQMIPDVAQAGELKKELEDLSGNFAIEGIFFIPRTDRLSEEEELLNIMNILSRISSLEGLEYYSASRGEMRLLFEECWRLEDLEGDRVLEDLHHDTLPERSSFYMHQKDLTFGANRSAVTMTSNGETLLMSMKTMTNMKYNGLVRVIKEGNFYTGVLVIPVEEGILYYGTMSARTLQVGLVVNKASKSFYNRMKALFFWFSEQYSEEAAQRQ